MPSDSRRTRREENRSPMAPHRGAPAARVRALDARSPRSDAAYVLYWMTASRRLEWNHALDHAVAWAERLQKPLLVFEPLNVGYRWASERIHRAIIDGMVEHAAALASTPVGYFPYVEPSAGG